MDLANVIIVHNFQIGCYILERVPHVSRLGRQILIAKQADQISLLLPPHFVNAKIKLFS